jgi:hypothetical protein
VASATKSEEKGRNEEGRKRGGQEESPEDVEDEAVRSRSPSPAFLVSCIPDFPDPASPGPANERTNRDTKAEERRMAGILLHLDLHR